MGRLGKQAWLEACRGLKKSALAGGGEVDILGLQASKQWVLHKFTSKRWLCTLLGHSLHSLHSLHCLHCLHSSHCLHCLLYFLGQSDHTGAAAVLYASFNAFELHLFLTFLKKNWHNGLLDGVPEECRRRKECLNLLTPKFGHLPVKRCKDQTGQLD